MAGAGALVLLATVLGCLWMTDRNGQSSVAPGLVNGTRAVLIIQSILLIGLVIVVWVLRRSDESQRTSDWQPFLGGWLTPLVSLIAVLLGGLLSASTNLAVARLFGQPSGVRLPAERPTPSTLFVPDEAFAFAIGTVAALAGGGTKANPEADRGGDRQEAATGRFVGVLRHPQATADQREPDH